MEDQISRARLLSQQSRSRTIQSQRSIHLTCEQIDKTAIALESSLKLLDRSLRVSGLTPVTRPARRP